MMVTYGTQFSAFDAFLQSVRRDLDHTNALLVLSKGNIHSSGNNWGKYSTNKLFYYSCLTARPRPNSVGEVWQSMTGAVQMIAVTNLRQPKNALRRRADAYRPSREKSYISNWSAWFYLLHMKIAPTHPSPEVGHTELGKHSLETKQSNCS